MIAARLRHWLRLEDSVASSRAAESRQQLVRRQAGELRLPRPPSAPRPRRRRCSVTTSPIAAIPPGHIEHRHVHRHQSALRNPDAVRGRRAPCSTARADSRPHTPPTPSRSARERARCTWRGSSPFRRARSSADRRSRAQKSHDRLRRRPGRRPPRTEDPGPIASQRSRERVAAALLSVCRKIVTEPQLRDRRRRIAPIWTRRLPSSSSAE